MGKIKSKSIKRSTRILIEKGIEFKDSFDDNKKLLEGILPNKKTRNQMAGYLSRIKKQEKSGKKQRIEKIE